LLLPPPPPPLPPFPLLHHFVKAFIGAVADFEREVGVAGAAELFSLSSK
jgi:hypothetical protein